MDPLIAVLLIGGVALFGFIVGQMTRAFFSFAPWGPSSVRMARQALEFIQPRSGMTFVDLGSGDGRIVLLAGRMYGMQAKGFESSLLPYYLARLRLLFYPSVPASVERKDFYAQPLSDYDVIYFFGLPGTISTSLAPKLRKEVKPGAYVISYSFSVPGKKPVKILRDKWRVVFIYRW